MQAIGVLRGAYLTVGLLVKNNETVSFLPLVYLSFFSLGFVHTVNNYRAKHQSLTIFTTRYNLLLLTKGYARKLCKYICVVYMAVSHSLTT